MIIIKIQIFHICFFQISITFPHTFQVSPPPLIHFIQSLFITLPICSLSTPLSSPYFRHMRFTFFNYYSRVSLFICLCTNIHVLCCCCCSYALAIALSVSFSLNILPFVLSHLLCIFCPHEKRGNRLLNTLNIL